MTINTDIHIVLGANSIAGETPEWTPLQPLTSSGYTPIAYYDLDDSLVTNISGGTATNNDEILTVHDMTPNSLGMTRTQGVGTSPVYLTDQLNGHSIAYFDGVDDVLESVWYNEPLPQPFTNVLVMKWSAEDIAAGIRQFAFDGVGGDDRHGIYIVSDESNQRLRAGKSLLWGTIDSDWHVITTVANSTSSSISVDGSVTEGDAGDDGLRGTQWGARFDYKSPGNVSIAWNATWPYALDSTDIVEIESWLNFRYGLLAF
jgi:hypothetical protein